ncbi:MAG: hypothetical protein AAFU79_18910 [Myxococcota bacterium]
MSAPRRYHPFYCEENAWWLLQEGALPDPAWAIFITNTSRQVAMWGQRTAPPGQPVVWDYHVVAASGAPGEMLIWDLDCRGGAPLSGLEWWAASFPVLPPPDLAARFRVVPRDVLASRFASDRRHMLSADGLWSAPPPPWPCIRGPEATHEEHSLPAFLDLESHPDLGEVRDGTGFRAWVTGDMAFDGQPV